MHQRRQSIVLFASALSVFLVSLLLTAISMQRWLIYKHHPMTKSEEEKWLDYYKLPESIAYDIPASPTLSQLNSPFALQNAVADAHPSSSSEYIRAYWIPMDDVDARKSAPTVLYLHGQHGLCRHGLSSAVRWRKKFAVNVLVINYRGFGLSSSEGFPTQSSILVDAQHAFDHLLQKMNDEAYDSKKIIIYGHSLGGSVALHLAARNVPNLEAVIVENSFITLPHAVFKFSWLSNLLTPLISDHWNSYDQLPLLAANVASLPTLADGDGTFSKPKVLFIVGEKDPIVAPWHTLKLEQRAREFNLITQLHSFPNCKHSCHDEPGYLQALAEFIKRH